MGMDLVYFKEEPVGPNPEGFQRVNDYTVTTEVKYKTNLQKLQEKLQMLSQQETHSKETKNQASFIKLEEFIKLIKRSPHLLKKTLGAVKIASGDLMMSAVPSQVKDIVKIAKKSPSSAIRTLRAAAEVEVEDFMES